jgi:histidine ammonia-lyase
VVSVHGAAKDTCNHVLSIFLDEVNGVTENPTIFPDEQLVQYTSEVDPYPLLLALSFLSTAVNGLGELSAARVKLLVNEQKLTAETTGDAETILATIAGDARPLLSLTMLGDLSTGGHQHAIDTAVLVPTGALQLVENVEKVFALELLVAMQTLTVGTRYEGSASIQQLVQDFTQQVSPANKAHLTNDNMLHAIRFIQSYAI